MLVNIGQSNQSEIPVFVADGMMGVLTCDKDLVNGELLIPSKRYNVVIKGVAPFGFYECDQLKKVVFFDARVVIVYECAFAQSGIVDMVFIHFINQLKVVPDTD